MEARRDEFYQYLSRVQVRQVINKNTVVEGFTAEQAIELTNFFFDRMMGPRDPSHVASMIKYYTTDHPGSPDAGLEKRASNLATSDDKPLIVRQFVGTMS